MGGIVELRARWRGHGPSEQGIVGAEHPVIEPGPHVLQDDGHREVVGHVARLVGVEDEVVQLLEGDASVPSSRAGSARPCWGCRRSWPAPVRDGGRSDGCPFQAPRADRTWGS